VIVYEIRYQLMGQVKCTACARLVYGVHNQVLTGVGRGNFIPSDPGMVVQKEDVHGCRALGAVHRALATPLGAGGRSL